MHRFLFHTFVVLLVVCLNAVSASAVTYYVSRFGDDSRPKIRAQNRNTPWQTIQGALDRVRGSDTIIVLNGLYREDIRFNKSGFRDGNITLKAENKHGARVIGSIAGYDRRYITVDGFDVTNPNLQPLSKGISFDRCHHVTIRNCRARFCAGGGIAVDQCDWVLIEGNLVHHNAFFNPSQHSGISIYQPQQRSADENYWGHVVRGNICYRNRNRVNSPLFGRPTDGNGIVLDDFKNTQEPFGNGITYDRPTLVENNLCYDNGGQGIHIHLANNCDVRNNTCVGNMLTFDFGAEVTIGGSSNIAVYNNVLSAIPGQRAVLQYGSDDFWVGFNLIDGIVQNTPNGGGNIFAAPLFRPGRFSLLPSSPGVDAGIDFGGYAPVDLDGNDRFVGQIDLGAYEVQ